MRSLGAHLREKGSDDSGLSVLEIVIASAILLISSISVIGALTFGSTASAQTTMRAHALNLANQRIEYARNLAYDDMGIVSGSPEGKIPAEETVGPFTVTTDVSWAVGTSEAGLPLKKYKTIRVTVDWIRPRPGSISMSSAIYGKSYLVNVGDIQVRVRDADTGEPITSAEVWLHRPGVAPVFRLVDISGENAGNTLFGPLSTQPSALASVTVVAGDYVFDESALGNITVIPDYVTTVVAMGYRAGTVTVHVVDRKGTKVSPAEVWVLPPGVVPDKRDAKPVGGDGMTTFTGLRKGDYLVYVRAPNRTVSETRFSITQGGQVSELWVELADMVVSKSLQVLVRDPNGMPLDGVSVDVLGPAPLLVSVPIGPLNTVNGEAVFTPLTLGDYRVTTTLAGYSSVTASATVADVPASVLLTLVPVGPTGSLKIIVDGAAGPTAGLQVRITYPSNKFITLTTDANGEILLGNLLPGKYLVEPAGMAMTEHIVYEGQMIEVRRTGP